MAELTDAQIIEQAVVEGNLKALNPAQRAMHYKNVCTALELNFLMHPLDYYTDREGEVRLEVNKEGAAQLRKVRDISITSLQRDIADGIVIFTATARDKDKREDVGTGAVSLVNLTGIDKANAIMTAETKAKRRVTISLAGSGLLAEDEVESMRANDTAKGALAPASQPTPVVPIELPQVYAGPVVIDAPAKPAAPVASLVPATESVTLNTPAQPTEPLRVKVEGVPAQENAPQATDKPKSAPSTGLFKAPDAAPLQKPTAPPKVDVPKATIPPIQEPGPVQEAVAAAAPTLAVAPVAPKNTNVGAPTPKELHQLQTRASVIARDHLAKAGMRDGGNQLKLWLERRAGKTSLPKLTAEEWNAGLAEVEAKIPEGPLAMATFVNPDFKPAA